MAFDNDPVIDDLAKKRAVKLERAGSYADGPVENPGDLRMAIAAKAKHVIMAFGAPVTWVALSPAEATTIAAQLLQGAANVNDGRGG